MLKHNHRPTGALETAARIPRMQQKPLYGGMIHDRQVSQYMTDAFKIASPVVCWCGKQTTSFNLFNEIASISFELNDYLLQANLHMTDH